jgi:DNA-directed RNA polymerase specialized sigma24 family protein
MQSHSITVWLEELKRGNGDAARRIWERYFPDLVALARQKLRGVPQRMEDEEDVALSALDSFCRAADLGRFPDLNDRRSLWRLLSRITHRKAIDVARRTHTKLGEANVRHLESSVAENGRVLDLAHDNELEADVAAMVTEQLHHLLQLLPDNQLRRIAIARMEGRTNKEIAQLIGRAVRTVERRLAYIRVIWKEEADLPDEGK